MTCKARECSEVLGCHLHLCCTVDRVASHPSGKQRECSQIVAYSAHHADSGAIGSVQHSITKVLAPEVAPGKPWAELRVRVPNDSKNAPRNVRPPMYRPFAAPCSASMPEALVGFSGSLWKVSVPALSQLAGQTSSSSALTPPVCTPVAMIGPKRIPQGSVSEATWVRQDMACFDSPLAGVCFCNIGSSCS
jgi:hypothetical protein